MGGPLFIIIIAFMGFLILLNMIVRILKEYERGVVTGAKAMVMTVIDLLSDDARLARQVKAEYDAPMTKEQYLSLMRGMFHEGSYTK